MENFFSEEEFENLRKESQEWSGDQWRELLTLIVNPPAESRNLSQSQHRESDKDYIPTHSDEDIDKLQETFLEASREISEIEKQLVNDWNEGNVKESEDKSDEKKNHEDAINLVSKYGDITKEEAEIRLNNNDNDVINTLLESLM